MNKLIKIISIILLQVFLLMPAQAFSVSEDSSDTLSPAITIKAKEFQAAVFNNYSNRNLIGNQSGRLQVEDGIENPLERIERFYEGVANNGWGENKNFSLWGAMPELVLYLVQRIKAKKILSCGIGLAEMERRLSLNNDVTCIDNVPGLVEKAKENGLNAFLGDANDLSGFADNEFDLIIFPFSIAHVNDIVSVCEQAKRILKDNGEILIISQSPANGNTVAHSRLYGYTLYPVDRLKQFVKQAGLFIEYLIDNLILIGDNEPKKIKVNYILASKAKIDKDSVNRTLIPSYGNNSYQRDNFVKLQIIKQIITANELINSAI
ncbi:MAG: class I SAM-dependent methyltransferase [Candidatus Omnitrophica bacterium]|nr:class I SAM-dependent methyltransferase [Candidatus Omnitrophota bacterium]